MNHLFAFVVLCTRRVHPGVALIVMRCNTTPWILKVRRRFFKACLMRPVNTCAKWIINKCSKQRAFYFISNYLSGNIFRAPKLRSASVLLRSKPIYQPSFSHEEFQWAKTCVRDQANITALHRNAISTALVRVHTSRKMCFCVRVRREQRRWGGGDATKFLQSRSVPLLIKDCSQKMVADMR